jgi:hypothetical protein
MIDRGHDLPITKQAEVLRISRGSIYYLPRPVPEADLAIMRHLEQHMPSPTSGYFKAATAATLKTHRVVIDRIRMILRSREGTSSTGAQSTKYKSHLRERRPQRRR